MLTETDRLRYRLGGALFTVLFMAVGINSVNAQVTNSNQSAAESIEQANWNQGYHGLALVCRSLGMQVHSDINSWSAKPRKERIVIILGNSIPRRLAPTRISNNGGAALVACDGRADVDLNGANYRFRKDKPVMASSQYDCYNGLNDCPIISSLSKEHPSTIGVKQIVTNRPVALVKARFQRARAIRTIGVFPRTVDSEDNVLFGVATTAASNKQILVCSDPSVFTNQMITLGDNAKFAINTLAWLQGTKATKRTHVLIVVDGYVIAPPYPDRLDINIPPPSPDEVLEALKHLPKDKLLQVGNQLAAMVQEENLPNELLAEAARDVLPIKYQRALVFAATALLGLFLLFRYLKSESLLQDALGVGKNPDKERRVEANYRQAGERRAVAAELVGRFYGEVSGGQRINADFFPQGLTVNKELPAVWKEMKRMGKNIRCKKARWWTKSRLQKLCSQLEYWNEMRRNQSLVVETTS